MDRTRQALAEMAREDPGLAARLVVQTLPGAAAKVPGKLTYSLHVADVGDVLWKLQYDFYYIKNFSFWLDLLIIAGTVRTVLGGYGAR